nr:unnamed protein product [Spirometra erinaceieuropaei]
MHSVEDFRQIRDGRIKVRPHLRTLLLKLTGDEDRVLGLTVAAKAALALWQKTMFQMVVQVVEEDSSADIPGDVQQRNASVVVADLADSLDCEEEIHSFVAVRVPLDLFGLASRPSVLHLPQPLLCNAATAVEDCFVVIGGAIDVGFMQSILLGEQFADGGVFVTEPVLMLTTCATKDSQGRRMNCVPELASPVLNGSIPLDDGDGDCKFG